MAMPGVNVDRRVELVAREMVAKDEAEPEPELGEATDGYAEAEMEGEMSRTDDSQNNKTSVLMLRHGPPSERLSKKLRM
jgi:hypothetical protein